jgi:hypothetical protein
MHALLGVNCPRFIDRMGNGYQSYSKTEPVLTPFAPRNAKFFQRARYGSWSFGVGWGEISERWFRPLPGLQVFFLIVLGNFLIGVEYPFNSRRLPFGRQEH